MVFPFMFFHYNRLKKLCKAFYYCIILRLAYNSLNTLGGKYAKTIKEQETTKKDLDSPRDNDPAGLPILGVGKHNAQPRIPECPAQTKRPDHLCG
jgi:hypothetical protein